ncbi:MULTISPECIES: 23S rRNA (guanosine(2251)-2'-O)-methyltransferase RlmB [unclassified Nesterenkonia]|uniref:23S rRNA (guanosine(2251)-2'-O)-methyltransferase RlmB n=1 Tax=unclassified Nesterenkonia TaxID=2629769 RepID=UPI0008720008|nr:MULTISPECIES: 23S rRNA (guanosine(2251)-2'-O)-methyltransferase RlmB [unclassified Nesterenkonia]MDS2171080.1 23S rRNA (guanosine(2251)-2'-O)-methyltransferase RlmB [Nesterenkonia sp. CL21]OSM42047.1 23S rRNA (guanosine(2251)-2'-O)-methyltransferase RlmB [Nesterenkonia sp. PF2B19]
MAKDSRPKSAAVRKKQKKGAVVGSGGQGRRKLEGKGPTPKAEDRVYHKAHRQKKLAERAQAKQTQQQSRGRRGSGHGADDVVAGRNAVVEALAERVPARELHIATDIDSDGRVRDALRHAAEQGVRVKEVARRQLDTTTGDAVHQGVALVLEPYDYADPVELTESLLESAKKGHIPHQPLLVACDSITDPRNLGAILRASAAFDADAVMIPERRSAGVTATAWKTSAGAAARIPVARAKNLTQALKEAKDQGYFVLGLDGGGEVELPGLELALEPIILVVGSEGRGLSRLVRETCDQIVSVPIASSTESLNASMAVGISLYEVAMRRRRAD